MPGTSGDPQGRPPVAAVSPEEARLAWMPRLIPPFAVVTVAFLAAYAYGPAEEQRPALYFISHLISAAAFTAGVFSSRRGFRRDWMFMLAAMYVWVLGDLTGVFTLDAEGMPASWVPGVVLSLIAYCLVTVGVFRLANRDGFVRGSAVRIDGTVFLISVALAWWLLVGQDLAARWDVLTPAMIVAGIPPVGDGLLLAGASALTSSRAAHSLSARALIATALAGLVGDFLFARVAFGYAVPYPSLIAALWMIQFACAGVAALASGRPAARERNEMTVAAIMFVIVALVLPALFAVYAAVFPADGLRVDGESFVVVAVGTGLMAVLVSVRASMLLRRIQRQAADLERTARTDALTQLPNRRAGERLLDEAIIAAGDAGSPPLTVALVDLDHFKRFNDTYGHPQGDRLLRVAGRAWADTLDGQGAMFRYGGEEFVVVLPAIDARRARDLLDELRRVTPFDQTFSAGLATFQPGDDVQTLIGRADVSLYEAKAAGRARTVEAIPGGADPRTRPDPPDGPD